MTAYLFEPPTVELIRTYEVEPDPYQPVTVPSRTLFSRVRRGPVGQTVLKHADGSYETLTYPTTDQIKAASVAYEGGHMHWVSATEAAQLRSAGFVVVELPDPPAVGNFDPPPVYVEPSKVHFATYAEAIAYFGSWNAAAAEYSSWNDLAGRPNGRHFNENPPTPEAPPSGKSTSWAEAATRYTSWADASEHYRTWRDL